MVSDLREISSRFPSLVLAGTCPRVAASVRLPVAAPPIQKIRIVRHEGLGYVLAAKEQPIVPRSEFHWTPEMILIQPPVCFRALQFHAQGSDATPYSPPADRNDPGKAHIDQCGRLRLLREQPYEFNRAFLRLAPRFGSLPDTSGVCSAQVDPGRRETSGCRARRSPLDCNARSAPRSRVSGRSPGSPLTSWIAT